MITPNEAYFYKWILALLEPAYLGESECMQPCYLTPEIVEALDYKFDNLVKQVAKKVKQ